MSPDTDSADSPASEEVEGGTSIGDVAELLGVPAPTLRSWELRYGVLATARTTGGHRRYTRDQIDVFRRMQELIAAGHRPGEAATRAQSEFDTSPATLVEEFVAAAEALRPNVISDVLETARQNLGLARTIDDVLLPALRRIGDLWARDPTRIAQEHVASYAAHTWLAASSKSPQWPSSTRPTILLCCAPDEQHTLALEAFAALLRERGADCRVLGGRTPIAALTHAVRITNAVALVLVCHLPAGHHGAIEALRAIRLPASKIFYAGGAFATPSARLGATGTYLGENLSRATDLILQHA